MIVFDLICKEQHRFEGWFTSGEDFAAQTDRGQIECPVCGCAHVKKLPAAKIRRQSEAPSVPAQTESGATTSKPDRVELSRVIDYIFSHTEDVGKNFAEEARKIHYEEAAHRNIRGVASRTEAEDLREEGIPVFSLPIPPQDRWN